MPARYSSTHQVMHWLTVAMMSAVLPLGWMVVTAPEDSTVFYYWLDVHQLVGLSILTLTSARILWRIVDRPPAMPPGVGTWSARIAHGVAGGLLLMMIAMPMTGYLWTTGHGYDVAPFHWFQLPRFFYKDKPVGDFAKELHLWGRWIVYSLILLHLAGVSYHVIWRRDRLLERMLPPQIPEAGPE